MQIMLSYGVRDFSLFIFVIFLAIVENSHDAIPQIVADCLVRQGVPGPCLGTKKRSKLAFRGRLATLEQDDDQDVVMEAEDVPEEENDEISSDHNHDTLTGKSCSLMGCVPKT